MNTSNSLQYNYIRKIIRDTYKEYCKTLLPTINLLKSSLLVSVSGALRIYIASLLLLAQISVLNCIAGGLIVYAVYTLDRALESTEDSVNRSELKGSNKKLALFVSLATFVSGCYVLNTSDLLILALMPLVVGYLYSKGLNFGKLNLKLKGGLGIKNLVVGLTWGTFIAGIAGTGIKNPLPVLLVFCYYGSKLFINSTIYDFKDVKGDLMAGIKTLPVSIGEKNTRLLLLGLHIASHLMLSSAIIMNLLAFEPVIIMYSFFIGLLYIFRLTHNREKEDMRGKIERLFFVDGEAGSIVYLRSVIGNVI
ncbi:UbiA family prenyltransferase [Methanomethylovorans sp.]|uniref:UbiA family prenyltransferase n=1 Tax=Methanomethylovorans sp. TaxID=2758717 RepID=UPI000AEE9330|nr:UbiA family prenyltransferase [Methanomethylovorans sp.]